MPHRTGFQASTGKAIENRNLEAPRSRTERLRAAFEEEADELTAEIENPDCTISGNTRLNS
jgi:hypothetical protein